MAPSSAPWQGPPDRGAKTYSMSGSLDRTIIWVATQQQFMPPPVPCQDPQACQTPAPAPPPQETTPSICSDLSELSDYPDGPAVRQTISLEALPNIGRNFLAAYNRIDTWFSIISLRQPQPLQTITTVQLIVKQARKVLTALFSIGCLPIRHLQEAKLALGGWQKDEL